MTDIMRTDVRFDRLAVHKIVFDNIINVYQHLFVYHLKCHRSTNELQLLKKKIVIEIIVVLLINHIEFGPFDYTVN